MRIISGLLFIFVMTVTLAACGEVNSGQDNTANITEPGVVTPDNSNVEQPSETKDEDGIEEPAEPGSNEPPAATIEIELTVEGEREKRTGTLVVSDNGYYLYTLPQFKFTPEEPNMDQVYMDNFEEFYMRIQTLGADADLPAVRANAEEELAMLGDVVEMKDEQIGEPALRDSIFYLHSSDSTLSKYIILRDVGGKLFKVTVNMPNSEAAEGAGPGFPAMIKTIQPTNR
jgi:hypothetical protein